MQGCHLQNLTRVNSCASHLIRCIFQTIKSIYGVYVMATTNDSSKKKQLEKEKEDRQLAILRECRGIYAKSLTHLKEDEKEALFTCLSRPDLITKDIYKEIGNLTPISPLIKRVLTDEARSALLDAAKHIEISSKANLALTDLRPSLIPIVNEQTIIFAILNIIYGSDLAKAKPDAQGLIPVKYLKMRSWANRSEQAFRFMEESFIRDFYALFAGNYIITTANTELAGTIGYYPGALSVEDTTKLPGHDLTQLYVIPLLDPKQSSGRSYRVMFGDKHSPSTLYGSVALLAQHSRQNLLASDVTETYLSEHTMELPQYHRLFAMHGFATEP